ncbi:hypothetical protein [Tabrizicola sp.]|uniref:hypothetical protein n=1 Tax=Tabrizicola sp. TaxID=2005166 RepID=UPI00286ABFB8|nr:hypothetical protein [Tabrizicola sp.]
MNRHMTRMMLALSLGFGGVILATQNGFANPQCAPRADVIEGLAQNYGETRRSLGIAANSTVMELFAADATGTWTLTVTTPDGMTCLVASGMGYEAISDPLPAQGSKV